MPLVALPPAHLERTADFVRGPQRYRVLLPTMRGLGAVSTVQQMVVNAANQYGVPPSIALGIASHESNFNPSATHVNSNGTTDWGVMQLNDSTVQTLGVQNPLDPQQNINAGVSLLAKYYQQYGNWSDALQAYAAGPGSVSSSPSNAVQGFVSYVLGYSAPGGSVSASWDSGDTSSSSSFLSNLDFSDPTTIAVTIALVFGVGYVLSEIV